jgi:hypothetical protein
MSASETQQSNQPKRCFVIAPIGSDGSPERLRSDQVLQHVIRPAAMECGYDAASIVRADKEAAAGIISTQVVNHLMEDELVIADLTGHNPNVFYELAIRHAVGKPVVQIIEKGERIPFDISHVRTIMLDHHDLDSAAFCRAELARSIRAVERDPSLVDSPITQAITIRALSQSSDPAENRDAQMLRMLQDLSIRVDEMSVIAQYMAFPGTTSGAHNVYSKGSPRRKAMLERAVRDVVSQYVAENPYRLCTNEEVVKNYASYLDTMLPPFTTYVEMKNSVEKWALQDINGLVEPSQAPAPLD